MSDHNDDAGSVVADRVGGDPAETAREIDARVYRVLGEQFLARPGRERADAVGIWASEWRCNAERLPPEFDAALDRIEDGATADAETLRTAYTHLFRGVSERAPDPPYESMYLDGSFYSGTTTEIRKGYRWAGFDVDDTHGNEPPDHLGLELQFLGELVAMDDGDRDPDEPDTEDALWWLLDEHLTEWLPAYHARLQREGPHEYYAGLLDLALAVVTSHHKRLAEDR
ncbi:MULTISPECIES: TorD/DmsD family molecular chaperone [Halomicrobium]|uniref:Cytoplasmic chaperone TorD family protein n=2 Tax=Halomicrobium mukohataei TaxID=57705 RepID=C7P3K6_HALMD|nr:MULTISPECIES: molecular chaperone TorD family protein [Halomicrobium]ACV47678.1 cytoplasmic chaperone TorD family protein [Halomicrobium mukohataei DSM 12286]QCD66133.1 cytoplasmic chaperone TorD family protein [Halomicrobium mukohataei]QFR20938.1 cytoplasmic chaperone TorD family protein [Halomicrobium sp. ZPS1]